MTTSRLPQTCPIGHPVASSKAPRSPRLLGLNRRFREPTTTRVGLLVFGVRWRSHDAE